MLSCKPLQVSQVSRNRYVEAVFFTTFSNSLKLVIFSIEVNSFASLKKFSLVNYHYSNSPSMTLGLHSCYEKIPLNFRLEASFLLLCFPPNITGEMLYCFTRRLLIFSFSRRVIYHSKGLC